MKTCNCCGRYYETIPAKAVYHENALPPGFYYNCNCKSTLVWSAPKTEMDSFMAAVIDLRTEVIEELGQHWHWLLATYIAFTLFVIAIAR